MSSSRVAQILSTLRREESETLGLPELLCQACAHALPVSGVGLAIMTEKGSGGAIAATNETAKVMEELQLGLGEGPCVDASREGRPVLQPDLESTAPHTWPVFGPAVLEAGIAAIFAFPLHVGGISLGVLDLYRDTPGHLDDEELTEALAFADAATVILLQLQDRTQPGDVLHEQLSDPVEGSREVHQATGMISVQAAVGLTEALLLLRGNAYAAERTVLQAARDVITRRLRFDPEDDHHE